MPGLELHKAKLQLAAAAGRLPDVASIDSFWLPLSEERRAAAGRPTGPQRTAATFSRSRSRRCRTPRAMSTACGTRPTAACSSTARISCRRRRAPGTSSSTRRAASRASSSVAGYLYNAGRWEATVFDHLAMFWAQGGELVDGDGRPIFGEEPHRRAMLRLLGFLRDTIQRGASPRSVLGNNDYQQLTGAAVAGDVAMFLGGNWQLKDLQAGLAARRVREVGHRADSSGRRRHAIDRHRRLGLGRLRARPGAAARRDRVHPRRRVAGARRAHQRSHRPSAGAPERLSRFPDLQPGPVVPALRGDARGRPRAADRADLPGDFPARSSSRSDRWSSGEKTPDEALDEAWRAVNDEYARQAMSRTSAARSGVDALAWMPIVLAIVFPVAIFWRRTSFRRRRRRPRGCSRRSRW